MRDYTGKTHIGRRFERLVIIGVQPKRKGKPRVFDCKCDCGEVTSARLHHLTSGGKRSCGCLRFEMRKTIGSANLIPMVGKKFGRLEVISEGGRTGNGAVKWLCRCECGSLKEIPGVNLRKTDGTRSCGCIQNEMRRARCHEDPWHPSFVYFKAQNHRKLKVGLTQDQYKTLVSRPCHYCGVPGSKDPGSSQLRAAGILISGIDRKDSSLGYVPGNCVPCCWECNSAKGALLYDEFLGSVCRRYLHLFGSN